MTEGEPQGMLLRRRDVLSWLGIHVKTFEKWVHCGVLRPVFVGSQGEKPFYLKNEVRQLVEDAIHERERTD